MFAKAGLEANHSPENAGGTALVHYSLHVTPANIQCMFEINITEDSII